MWKGKEKHGAKIDSGNKRERDTQKTRTASGLMKLDFELHKETQLQLLAAFRKMP